MVKSVKIVGMVLVVKVKGKGLKVKGKILRINVFSFCDSLSKPFCPVK